MRDLLLMAITAVLATASVANPFVGMLSYTGYSLLGPHSQTWSIARTFPHVQLIAMATMLGFLFSTRKRALPQGREVVLLIGLMIVFLLSTLFGLEPERAREDLVRMVKIVVMVLLSTLIIDTPRRLHLLLQVMSLSLGIYAVKVGLFFVRTGGTGMVFGPEETFLEANNAIGVALAMNVAFLVYLARLEPRPWLARAMRLMALLSYPAVIGTASRGAWLGLALVTLLLVLRGAVSRTRTLAGVLVLVVLASALSFSAPENVVDRYDRLVNYNEDRSAVSRFWNWEFCATVGSRRPALGAGFSFYSLDAYARYMPQFLEEWPGKVWSCHNMFLSVFAEHGVTGFLIWVGLLLSCLRAAGRMRKHRGAPDERWVPVYGEMIEAALLGYMLMGMFLDFAYFEVYYQLVGIVIIARGVIKRPHESPVARPAVATPAPFSIRALRG
jgi:probable O-glycosylation ligase (exosortase A-associated)